MEIFRLLVWSFLGTIGGAAVFAIVVSCLPAHNPLRQVLSALLYRFGATAAVMVVDVPALGVPVLGEVFDVVTWIWLIYYWVTFVRDIRLALAPPPQFDWRGIDPDRPIPVTRREPRQ